MKSAKGSEKTHYLIGHYVTHQPDGAHYKARCTCDMKLEGMGVDESAAMQSLWKAFTEHTKKSK